MKVRRLVAAALAVALVPLVVPAPANGAPMDLVSLLDRRVAAFPAGAGVLVSDPIAGVTLYQHNENEVVITASLYKLAVLLEAERLVEAKQLRYQDEIGIEPEDITDDGAFEPAGTALALDEALERMITVSDNGTGHALVRVLDPGQINATLARSAIQPFHVRMNDEEDNAASPRAVARFFELLARKELVSKAASERMLARLERQQINDRLPAQLPADTVVAHKTGNLAFVTHDAGIIFGRGGRPVVVVVMTWNADTAEAVDLIQDVGSLVYANAFAAPTSVGFVVPRQPVPADAGRGLLQTIRVTNLGSVDWRLDDPDPFTLIWEMRDSLNNVVSRNRAPIALGNVRAHTSVDLPLVLPMPSTPGEYQVTLGLANRALGALAPFGVATETFTVRPHLPFLVAFEASLPSILHRDEASAMVVTLRPQPALVKERPIHIGWRLLDPRNQRQVARGEVVAGVARPNDTVRVFTFFKAPAVRGTYILELVAVTGDTSIVASASQRRSVVISGPRTYGDELPDERRPIVVPRRPPPVPLPTVSLPPLPAPLGKTPPPSR